MLDKLPDELFSRVSEFLTQRDKISLSYVSKAVYDKILSSIYQNLYLNERPYYPTDLDPLLGSSKWSYLAYSLDRDLKTKNLLCMEKFKILIESLDNNKIKLAPLIRNIHCNWNLDDTLMKQFINLLILYCNNLQSFDNYIKDYITYSLIEKKTTLKTLTLTPPSKLPDVSMATEQYYNKLYKMIEPLDWNRIETLTIHVNACTFFEKRDKPLKIKSLCLNLRPDTHNTQPIDFINPTHYYDIFDIDALEELEILSWYNNNDSDLDLYEMWQLNDFLRFKNIKELILSSLFAKEPFITKCIKNFNNLETLKLDYMFDAPMSKTFLDTMGMSACKDKIKYIDIKFEPLDTALLFIEQDEISEFKINVVCKCDDCNETLHNVILKKYFPSQDSFTISDFSDVEDKNFLLQMFKLYPIIPYCHILGEYPPIAFNAASLSEHAKKVNSLLKYNPSDNTSISEEDIIKLYHAHTHSLKKTFDYFLQKFSNLQYLVLNDMPTKIIRVDEHQRCNVPIFHHFNYKSNQIYELVNAESLFS
ncbi:hypothetical protein TPHA_0A01650 [Tetrapisispora phaffii CBS 4417]|uniref:F-box domain-containing protein n=1 Tax=Tetrapisispora phaffii (strain ATCC 24235 / CBS 4417 / NBRC 1672 / NRRL Y-8282 / UCD 70-5) TaxID=1071381 RepID=G8BMX0_TETPH|nr:hypothetical protein TPHA_0A01650 [Tetrapisispora phaffii CBS 4417]CCE61248.1 hypothetical protein TPHA_0A01650 [Tetrapisispora phaffii CBS 4417]